MQTRPGEPRYRLGIRNCLIWGSAICAVIATMTGVMACGSSSPDPNRAETLGKGQTGETAFRGCGPESIAGQFGGFLNAVSQRQQAAALRYVAEADDLLEVTLYRGRGPDAGRVDATTPAEVFDTFTTAITEGESIALLVIAVGNVAPFADRYEDKAGVHSTAGVEVVARIGDSKSLSGKIGIDCDNGRIYLGAMNISEGLRPQSQCGKSIRLERQKPVLCRI
jgi:hypothetical protein